MPDPASPSVVDPASSAPGAAVESVVGPGGDDDPAVEPRRCSRCRAVFPGVEERNAAGHIVWWLCPPCHEALLGS